MALTLKPAKFYGSSLPRPRIYTDVKLNDERVDPPLPVLDPLLSWANDAHWSMGGLSFNRLRLQGKIEGNCKKLRKEIETKFKFNSPQPVSLSKKKKGGNGVGFDSAPLAPILKKRTQRRFESDDEEEWDDDDEESDDDEIEIERRIKEVKRDDGLRKKRRFVRKLVDEFDSVVSDDLTNGGGVDGVALRTRSRRSVKLMDEEDEGGDSGDKSKVDKQKGDVENGKVVNKKTGKGLDSVSGSPNGFRTSPRLKKRLN